MPRPPEGISSMLVDHLYRIWIVLESLAHLVAVTMATDKQAKQYYRYIKKYFKIYPCTLIF